MKVAGIMVLLFFQANIPLNPQVSKCTHQMVVLRSPNKETSMIIPLTYK